MTTTAIIGGGIVGICCAIALTDHGHDVTLIDKVEPGQQTSRWNAGVLATSSVIPLNTPATLQNLPRLITGRHPGFRLNRTAAPSLLGWGLRFLQQCRSGPSSQSISGLTALIGQSRKDHEALCARVGFNGLQQDGWLMTYRGATGPQRAETQAKSLRAHDVQAEVLTPEALQALEPNLKPVFQAAVHIVQSAFTDPASLCAAYLAFAKTQGVKLLRADIRHLSKTAGGVDISGTGGTVGRFDNVVLSLGPWTNPLLGSIGKALPLAVERGYLQTFETTKMPKRPFYDVDGGYVAAPRQSGVQISTGTELTTLKTKPNPKLFAPVNKLAHETLTLGAPIRPDIAVGNRPSLPDGLPVIGAISGFPGLWIAAGHQHVGFSTSSGTANLLASLMNDSPPPFDPQPFNPSRFSL